MAKDIAVRLRDTRPVPVSDEAVDALVDLIPEGDWTQAFADGETLERRRRRLAELASPELETAMIGPGGFTGTFSGTEGLEAAWRDWLEPFETYVVERDPEFQRTDNAVVFFARQIVRPKGSDSPIASEAAMVAFFEDGKLKRIEFHLERASALRSAGLG
jgi:hypothetical protein